MQYKITIYLDHSFSIQKSSLWHPKGQPTSRDLSFHYILHFAPNAFFRLNQFKLIHTPTGSVQVPRNIKPRTDKYYCVSQYMFFTNISEFERWWKPGKCCFRPMARPFSVKLLSKIFNARSKKMILPYKRFITSILIPILI
jgi:hypothetical protein